MLQALSSSMPVTCCDWTVRIPACWGEISSHVKNGIISKGSESAALHKGLVVDAGDILLEKPRFGAFHGTDRELILQSRGIDSIIVTGIATNVCCETTAREAAVRDFHERWYNYLRYWRSAGRPVAKSHMRHSRTAGR